VSAAREVLDKDGLTYTDRFGAPRARPEVAIERDSRIAFARLVRELALDVEAPPEPSRPPALKHQEMNNMSKIELLREGAGLAGAALIAYGAYLVHPALGYGVAGVFLMLGAMLSAWKPRGSR
jgi:hypothetical protein